MGRDSFIRECSDRTRGNGFKRKEGRSRLEILYCEGGETLEEVVDAPSLEVFKVRLDRALSNLV